MNSNLKKIKNILLSQNLLSKEILDPYSLAISSWYDPNTVLVKRTQDYLGNIMIFEPRKRRSFDPSEITLNYHTLWLSNNPKWSKYPKRDHAIIMAINKSELAFGENLYYMFPPNNVKLSICPTPDLTTSFYKKLDNIDIYSLNGTIKELLNILLILQDKDENILKEIDDSYELFISYINQIDENIKDILKYIKENNINFSSYKIMILKTLLEKNSILEYLKYFYDPKLFKLVSYPKFLKMDHKNNEVWTDVSCLGIHENYMKKNSNEWMKIVQKYKEA
jgi:hypothetical protein